MPEEIKARKLPRFRVPVKVWRILSFVAAAVVAVSFRQPMEPLGGRGGLAPADDAYLQADVTPLSVKLPG